MARKERITIGGKEWDLLYHADYSKRIAEGNADWASTQGYEIHPSRWDFT